MVTNAALKLGRDTIIETLTELYNKCLEEEKTGKFMDESDSSADPQKRGYHRGFELSTDKLIILFVQSFLQRHPSTFRLTNKPTAETSRS